MILRYTNNFSRMRKMLIIVYSAFLMIMLLNYFYYKNLYNRQIQYITELLDRQVQIVGLSVDNTNNSFSSDLNKIMFDEDLNRFLFQSRRSVQDKGKDETFLHSIPELCHRIKSV